MFFSETMMQQIKQNYIKVLPFLQDKENIITTNMEKLDGNHRVAMEYVYSSLPLSDIADYEFTLLYSFVKHAFMVAETMEWMKQIPESYFLHYVLHPRINSEDMSEHRELFYNMLYKRVKNMSMKEAVLEVNNWCLEQATYQSTDYRTASPLTVTTRGTARCGEESTLMVAALRSIGIPARQIYVPYWSHCDDQHAWVETWCDGKWYFTGACEPEPVFNRGWFTVPASRAMLVHSTLFSSVGMEQEEQISKEGAVTYLNHLKRYTKNSISLTIKVIDKDDHEVRDALVQFEIVNYGGFVRNCTCKTDRKGRVQITTGAGGLKVTVMKEGKTTVKFIHTKSENDNEILIVFDEREDKKEEIDRVIKEAWQDFSLEAPASNEPENMIPSAEDIRKQEQKNEKSSEIRVKRIESYYDEGFVNQFKRYPGITNALNEAKGNFNELRNFIDKEIQGADLYLKSKLLETLSKKDYADVKADTLEEHLTHALSYRDGMNEDIFVQFVLAPRVVRETLTPYRQFIEQYFTKEEKEDYKHNPMKLWEHIKETIHYYPEMEYTTIITTPKGALRLKAASPVSRKILFVAILRTLGIPAKLLPADESVWYRKGGRFIEVEEQAKNRSILMVKTNLATMPVYEEQWSLGRLNENGTYDKLSLWKTQWVDNTWTCNLAAGNYQLVTISRLTDGSVLGKYFTFSLTWGEERTIDLIFNNLSKKEMLTQLKIPDFVLEDKIESSIKASELCDGQPHIFVWLETGKEPTEHILNEMFENKEGLFKTKVSISFCLETLEDVKDKTLQKALSVLPNAKVYSVRDVETCKAIANIAEVNAEILPLVLVIDGNMQCVYAASGYQVGTASMLIKIIGLI